jgi:hypothetical protein
MRNTSNLDHSRRLGDGRRRGSGLLLIVVGVFLGVVGSAPASAPTGPYRVRAYATYYGWYDNTPPGCDTSYSGCAGGTGTFVDPMTFASDTAEFAIGTTVYYPTARKYFRMGDSCQECTLDWSGHGPDGGPHLYHLDLWIGGEGGDAFDAIDCESALTQARPDGGLKLTTFIVDPPADLPVSSQPLFNTVTGRCFGGATAPVTIGSYRNRFTGRCLADIGRQPGTAATTVPCRGRGDRIAFQGAFLLHGGRCLKTSGTGRVARTFWTECDGDAGEQWEVNPNGTITWVQYTRCLEARDHRVVMTGCHDSADEHWSFQPAARRAIRSAAARRVGARSPTCPNESPIRPKRRHARR